MTLQRRMYYNNIQNLENNKKMRNEQGFGGDPGGPDYNDPNPHHVSSHDRMNNKRRQAEKLVALMMAANNIIQGNQPEDRPPSRLGFDLPGMGHPKPRKHHPPEMRRENTRKKMKEARMMPPSVSQDPDEIPNTASGIGMGMQGPDRGIISQPPDHGLPMIGTFEEQFLAWFLWFWENGGNMDLGSMGPYMSQIYNIISGAVGGQFNQDGLNIILGNWGEMYA
jgi:hypothetical protein